MTVVVDNDPDNAHTLANAIVGGATTLPSLDHLRRHLDENPRENVVVLGVTVDAGACVQLRSVRAGYQLGTGRDPRPAPARHEHARGGAPVRRP
jgi:hypothetical protein